ncbi:bifunctional metallophosphatase/5'-nucleotidase [Photobacterium gaetbulicola]|nr:bifunctional UDP-sugar hydrolase/5'-nucleotidase [Photobacterium gaetbulicola]PSU13254.1 bifunctional metallophosphatase/5'-nucleotidase [Photobacterium gaetbulicola]
MKQIHRSAKITFAHINDTHSHFEPSTIALQIPSPSSGSTMSVFASCGGFARVSTAVREAKKQAMMHGREFMFVHAGDCFQGTLFFSLYKGTANATLLNAIGIDAMALGNHELDMGNQVVADFMDLANFPLLAGNWDLSNENKDKANPLSLKPNVMAYDSEHEHAKYLVKDVDGEPVAVFGLAIENMAGIANPDPDTHFLNVTAVAQNTVAAIKRAGINKIVVLSHLGYERDLELASQVDGVGAIIGGHTHTMQGDFSNIGFSVGDEYAVQINGTYVVQAGCNALALGQLELDFNADGTVARAAGRNQLLLGRQFTVDASRSEHLDDSTHQVVKDYLSAQGNVCFCVKDPQIENVLNQDYRPAVRELQTQQVAVLTESLRHIRVPDHKGPSQIAPLVVDSFVWSSRQRGHAVDFGIHNAGGVRASLHAGPITAADISGRLLPFAIGLMVYEVSGKQLRAALEGAINNAIDNGVEGTGSGSFPYTSRLKYTYRCCAAEGQRIEVLKLYRNGVWEDIQDHANYLSVSSGYTATGKEGYGALVNSNIDPIPLNITMADAFEEYARDRGSFGAFEQTMIDFIPCGCEQEHVA